MDALVLRCTAVTPIPQQELAAAVTDLDRTLRDQRSAPERVLRTVPLDPTQLGEALAWVARSTTFPSVQAGRRRWAVVRASKAVTR